MTQTTLQKSALDEIVTGCRQESAQRSAPSEQKFCFELFRRAFNDSNGEAWLAIQTQYQRLIYKWLHQAAKFSLTAEEFDDLYQDILLKFWRTLQRKANPLESHFTQVGAILSYLNQCVYSVCIDKKRALERRERMESTLIAKTDGDVSHVDEYPSSEGTYDDRISLIKKWVDEHVQDSREKLLIDLSFSQGLTPRAICKQFPDTFSDPREINRVRERIIKRARRALVQ